MSITLRYDETHIPIRVDLGAWLTAYGLLIGNRTDAIWMVKEDNKDADADALYTGVEADGGIEFEGNVALLYLLDFSALTAGKTYRFGFGLKFAGDTRFREIRLASPLLHIEQDFIRA